MSMKTSDRLATLERLRDRLAEQIDVCPSARDLALLSTRLEAVLSQIDELRPVEVSAADEIKRRVSSAGRGVSRWRSVMRRRGAAQA